MPRPKKPQAPDSGQQAVDFINRLTHTGDFNGVPFALRPWQETIIRRLFGTLRLDGRRQFTKLFLALPRKQGKTELAAGILLYLLLGTGKRDQQLYSASGDREQAALIYRAAASMVRNDPQLEEVCHVYDGYKRITCEPLNSFYDALSSEAPGKHGKNPSAVLFDELHVLPNRDLFNALTTGFATRCEPLTLMITTAGHDRTSLCYEQWKYARGVRDGLIDDPTFLPILYEASPEDDWTAEETWHKAMPGLGDFCSIDFIREECKRAQIFPAYENTFKQLYLDIWTEQATRWLTVESWNACGGPISIDSLRGEPCYGGLDLGVTGDMSAYALAFPGDDGVTFVCHFWAPKDGKWKDEPRNRDRYEQWAREGYLTFTQGNTTDHQQIEDDIVAWGEVYPLRQLDADRAYATQLLTRLLNIHGLPVKGITQGPVTMNEPTRKFEELVLAQQVHHGDNPILAWNVANAVIRRNTTGLMILDKEQAGERIDGLAACLNALAAMTSGDPDTGPLFTRLDLRISSEEHIMATTGVNFVEVIGAANAAFLTGTAVTNAPYLAGVDPTSALNLVNATPSNPAITARNGVCVDRVVFDPALTAVPPGVGTVFAAIGTYIGGYAKNGCVLISFNGTNAQTLNLTNTALVTPAATAGDTTFSNAGAILINNLGPAAVTISTTTGSNGANLPTMTTTNASITVPSGSVALYHANPVATVDATHKNIVITPANSTTLAITISGN